MTLSQASDLHAKSISVSKEVSKPTTVGRPSSTAKINSMQSLAAESNKSSKALSRAAVSNTTTNSLSSGSDMGRLNCTDDGGVGGAIESNSPLGPGTSLVDGRICVVEIVPTPSPTPSPTPVPPMVQFSSPIYIADEKTAAGVERYVTVNRSGSLTDAVSVIVTPNGGNGIYGRDYFFLGRPSSQNVVLNWAPNDNSSKNVYYEVTDNDVADGGKNLNFHLSDARGATIGANGSTRVWLYDDDGVFDSVIRSSPDSGMAYYLHIPKNCNSRGFESVVFSIDGSDRWYRGPAYQLGKHMAGRCFLGVVPISFSSGNTRPNDFLGLSEYYPDSVIDSVIGNRATYSTRFEFDERGIISIFGELVSEFKVRNSRQFAIFGHSGGANITKRIIFAYPELLYAAVDWNGNYWETAMGSYSSDASRVDLPILSIQTIEDPFRDNLESQWIEFQSQLDSHQYRNYSRAEYHGDHDTPQEDVILGFFEKVISTFRSDASDATVPR